MKVSNEFTQYLMVDEAAEAFEKFIKDRSEASEDLLRIQDEVRQLVRQYDYPELGDVDLACVRRNDGQIPVGIFYKGKHPALCKADGKGYRRFKKNLQLGKDIERVFSTYKRINVADNEYLGQFGVQGGYFTSSYMYSPAVARTSAGLVLYNIPLSSHVNDKLPDHPCLKQLSLSEWAKIVEEEE